jgi:Protein of unknown function (DUF1573)/Abnormal spindle-like microcephaly-assoc'd, ASPM-SPD-2-Hydin
MVPATPALAVAGVVEVVSSSSWLDPPTGTLLAVHIVGQVINNTGGNVTLVKIPISLKDSTGTIFDSTQSTFATVNVLGPGEVSPFEFLLQPVPTNYASFQTGTPSYATAVSQPYHTKLVVVTPSIPCSADYICGAVTNTGAVGVDGVRTIFTYVDGSNATVAQEYPMVDKANGGTTLAPGETGHFRFQLTPGEPVGTNMPIVLAEPNYPVELNPDLLDIGHVNVGKTGHADVSLRNNGSLPVTVSAIGTSNSEFAATTNCPGTGLAPGLSCRVTVQFMPAALGARTGTLTITDDAAGSPLTVPLTGTGTAPHVTFTPSTKLDFGSTQQVGAPGMTKTVTLLNDGTGPLAITSVSTDNAPTFTTDGSACPTALTAGTQCTISVTFASNIAGPFNGHLVVADDAGTGTQTLPLVGVASGPGDLVTPTSIDFHGVVVNQTSPAVTVTLTNNGNQTLTLSIGTPSGDFAKLNSTCGSSLAAGAHCTVDVTFKPTTTGDRTGSLTITDNTFVGQQSVSLKGKGVNSTLSFSPTRLDFGTQGLGSSTGLTDTVSNLGSAPLVITAVTPSGDYTETDDCVRTLQVNDTCTVTVTFRPTDVGTRSGAITITDNTPSGTDVLPLAGNVSNLIRMYTLDGYGGISSDGGSAQLATTAYWKGWKIARSSALLPDGSGGFVLDGYGGLHNFGSAAPESASAYFGWDIARDVAILPSSTKDSPMGYTLDGWGGVHPFGGAPDVSGTPYWKGRDVALRIALLSDGTGGYELDAYGGLHPFAIGNNTPPPEISNNGYWVNWRIVRSIALNPNSTHTSVSGVTLDGYGGVHPFNSAGDPAVVNPSGPYFGFDIARAVVVSNASTAARPQGWVLDGWGGLHAFGGAQDVAQGAYWKNFDIGVQLMLR